MSDQITIVPTRRPELVIRPLGDQGRYVVKNPRSGEFFHIGEQEQFLLSLLDGTHTPQDVCTAFSEQFREPLSESDFDGFLRLARSKGLLQSEPAGPPKTPGDEPGVQTSASLPDADAVPTAPPPRPRQSILFWRKSLFDPDRFFTWAAPKLWFLWTPAFLVLSAALIGWAAILVWTNGQELVSRFAHGLSARTLFLAWLTLLVTIACHEFAHGLTCKHFGGESHEVGFLLLCFIPCFYCNVTDAWLFREKSKRLWVMLAGGYCDLCTWALAVFVWRLSLPDSLTNYLAWVVLSVLGARTFFNFNPLLKLDGYYLLSDALEIPNLRQRAWDNVKRRLRWLLWGAPRPAAEPRGRFLLAFGMASWAFTLFFVALMLWGFFQYFWAGLGWLGLGAVTLLGYTTSRGLFHGLSGGEITIMITKRWKRTAAWMIVLGGAAAALCLVHIEDRASGPFQVRPATRAEVRAQVAGFLQAVYFTEGERVAPGELVARLDVPDLASRLAQKQAEIKETQARLRLLEIGPRPEEVAEQRLRVARMTNWRDLAEKDLSNALKALKEELTRLDKVVAQASAELNAARDAHERAQQLWNRRSIAEEQYRETERRFLVAQTVVSQAESQKRHREALGTREAIAGLDAEAELARRVKDLADAQAVLNIMNAGSRPEELDAERARLARLREEAAYLEVLRAKVLVTSPAPGLVTTPRLKEKIGLFFKEGELICEVEEPATLDVEITIPEQEVARVQAGQRVELKARALPFDLFDSHVDRLAPVAAKGDVQSSVTVYCRLHESSTDLRPGMSGNARIYSGHRPVGAILLERAMRFVRTEFWW
jgi:multidrug efflux pump subunit AcrA (membrane-fusion protein)